MAYFGDERGDDGCLALDDQKPVSRDFPGNNHDSDGRTDHRLRGNHVIIFSSNGYLNELLYRIGVIKLPIDWAQGGLRTLFMVAIADMWKVTPLVIIFLLSGLESIPSSIYEASASTGRPVSKTSSILPYR